VDTNHQEEEEGKVVEEEYFNIAGPSIAVSGSRMLTQDTLVCIRWSDGTVSGTGCDAFLDPEGKDVTTHAASRAIGIALSENKKG
jgi:hypothetical protein